MTVKTAPVVLSMLLLLLAAGVAHAYYAPGADIASADFDRLEQGDNRTLVTEISRDGRYVVFQTWARNFFADDDPDPPGEYRKGGIFRQDLVTRKLELVADGDLYNEDTNELLRFGAQSPSVSANGRYVAFWTNQSLVPGDSNDASDVYVRDMDRATDDGNAFELASAKDGGELPASYAAPAFPSPGGDPGSDIWPGKAISNDGRKVVFRTLEQASDLPDHASVDVPGRQLYLRDLDAHTTRLLSVDRATGEPAGGALGPAGISGDGTAALWVGQNAAAQTKFLAGEVIDSVRNYYLWKRIADGPSAPTRRITGVADLDDPGCPPTGSVTASPVATGPCYGPLTDNEEGFADISSTMPGISDDGYRIAFLASGSLRPSALSGPKRDLFLTDMSPGVTRKAGTVELTREGQGDDLTSNQSIDGVAISGDGQTIAIATTRIKFILPSPAFLGTPAEIPDFTELYAIDLSRMTIERVSRAYDGSEVNAGASSFLSLSGDGGRLAFTSLASNLFFGDANEQYDAFTATRTQPPPDTAAGDQEADSGPVAVPLSEPASARVSLSTKRTKSGALRVTVRVPSAGSVQATAKTRSAGSHSTKATETKKKRKKKRKKRRKSSVIARAKARVRAAGQTTLVLRPRKRYSKRLRKGKTVSGRLTVVFTPKSEDEPSLTTRKNVVFSR